MMNKYNFLFALDSEDHNLPVITSKDFQTMFQENKPRLIQVKSLYSARNDNYKQLMLLSFHFPHLPSEVYFRNSKSNMFYIIN